MLLTLTSTAAQASDLGYLLHKHPDRVQQFDLSFGSAFVHYPEATAERCTVALQIEVDSISLARRRGRRGDPGSIASYVNDRPYAAGSMLSVAIGRIFGTAMRGTCTARPELPDVRLPLRLHLPAVAARAGRGDEGGADLVERLFAPLGWSVKVGVSELAPGLGWGDSPYLDLTLTGDQRLADALSHLYVLLPVLDDAKHYHASMEEVDKLIRRGEGWLATHPERDLITRRYLAARRDWVDDALTRLDALDDRVEEAPTDEDAPPPPLKLRRLDAVLDALRDVDARSVADVGCGEGFYLRALLDDPRFTRILGLDVSARELDRAERRLGLERRSDQQRARISLKQSSVTYIDDDLSGFDAVLLVEVVEHIEPNRHDSLERSVFSAARPRHVVVTTPNVEHNHLFGMAPEELRHPDHRFEWTREQFRAWADGVASRTGYTVEYRPVGDEDPEHGPPTQLALFTRIDERSHRG